MMRARALAAAPLALLVACGGGDGDGAGGVAAPSTAEVVRADIVNVVEVDGVLGYEALDGSLATRVAGVVTWIADEGSTVQGGEPVFAVDDALVLLLVGDTPLHRDLVEGLSGPDVATLNQNLGIYSDVFTADTAAALRAVQERSGVAPSGVLRPAHAIVLPGAVRVGAHAVSVGTSVTEGTVVAASTSDHLVVTVDLPARRRGDVAAGDEVEVVLPGDEVVAAAVDAVATVAEAGEDGSEPTYEVVIGLGEAATGDAVDGAPVDVSFITARADDVLAVPVTALLALAEGGYGVERVGEDGTTTLVGVEVGMFSDSDDLVEIDGALDEGDTVVVAGS